MEASPKAFTLALVVAAPPRDRAFFLSAVLSLGAETLQACASPRGPDHRMIDVKAFFSAVVKALKGARHKSP